MKCDMEIGKTWRCIILHEKRLGSKQEPYIKNEEESLKPITYDYESLSVDEKTIYDSLG